MQDVFVLRPVSGRGTELGEVIAEIYAGKIAKWSDAKIAKLNEGLKLPDANITPVYRSDASGTTNIFTTYLSQVSEGWKKEFGAATTVSWPAGQGGKGNEGVTATVKQVPNAIGYVESAYAKQNKLSFTDPRELAYIVNYANSLGAEKVKK